MDTEMIVRSQQLLEDSVLSIGERCKEATYIFITINMSIWTREKERNAQLEYRWGDLLAVKWQKD